MPCNPVPPTLVHRSGNSAMNCTRFLGRRDFLRQAGSIGSIAFMAGLPDGPTSLAAANPEIRQEAGPSLADQSPQYQVKFAVCGMSHDHIYGMVDAIRRGGGELVSAWGSEEDKLTAFTRRYPAVPLAKTQDEILNNPSVQLVLSSQVANERAPLGIRAMRHGKDFLSDKPGMTTLEQLEGVRQAIAETQRIYGILYSERFEVRAAVYAGKLLEQGAIGKVIQTINIAPHQIF